MFIILDRNICNNNKILYGIIILLSHKEGYCYVDYIEVTTGMSAEQQETEPLVETVSGFILTLWYFSDHSDDIKLQRTIDNLLKCITLKVQRSTATA